MKARESQGQFEPASEDIHSAVCAEVVDLGMQDTPYGTKHQGLFIFQVEEKIEGGDRAGERKEVRAYFNITWGTESQQSNLRKWVSKWVGGFDSTEEMEDFEIESLEGEMCQLDISHKTSKQGRVRANVDSILPPPKKLKKKNRMKVSKGYLTFAEREARRSNYERDNGDSSEVPF